MGQLSDRVSRIIRAELNSDSAASEENYLREGTALVVGGTVTGASMGKVGILAGGTGYSLGAIPLAAIGALTGAALYEALRALIEDDASSTSAAVIGAATGTATSAAIGGVGIAIGGSAVGVGMASMAAGEAVVGLGLVGLNRLFQQGIDPEKLLDGAIEQMEADLQNARQAAINILASQKRLQQHYEQAQADVNKWNRRAQLALQKGDEYLAREALIRKKMHTGILSSLEAQLNQEPASAKTLQQQYEQAQADVNKWDRRAQLALQKGDEYLAREALIQKKMHTGILSSLEIQLNQKPAQSKTLQQKLILLEAKIFAAKSLKTRLKAQIAVAEVNEQLQKIGTSSAMLAFERMEEKMLQSEASNTLLSCSEVDVELEDLQRMLEQL